MFEGSCQCCVTFVSIVSSVPYWHATAYHHLSGNARGQRIVPVSERYPQVCLLYMNCNDKVTKLSVISGHAIQVFLADFFPQLDVTSQPVNAWKNNNPLAIWGHNAEAISWIGMYLKSLPLLNAIQSCSMFGKPRNEQCSANTTASVSTVLIITDLKPQFMASLTRISIRVSASSHEPGWSPSVFWPSLELTTLSNRANTMTLSHVSLEIQYCPRNWKSSSLGDPGEGLC